PRIVPCRFGRWRFSEWSKFPPFVIANAQCGSFAGIGDYYSNLKRFSNLELCRNDAAHADPRALIQTHGLACERSTVFARLCNSFGILRAELGSISHGLVSVGKRLHGPGLTLGDHERTFSVLLGVNTSLLGIVQSLTRDIPLKASKHYSENSNNRPEDADNNRNHNIALQLLYLFVLFAVCAALCGLAAWPV